MVARTRWWGRARSGMASTGPWRGWTASILSTETVTVSRRRRTSVQMTIFMGNFIPIALVFGCCFCIWYDFSRYFMFQHEFSISKFCIFQTMKYFHQCSGIKFKLATDMAFDPRICKIKTKYSLSAQLAEFLNGITEMV